MSKSQESQKFKDSFVATNEIDELYDFLQSYLIEFQGVEFTNLPSLSLLAYRILADGRWDRKKEIKEPYQPPKTNHLEENLIAAGYYKHEIDFGVRGDVATISKSEFKKLLSVLNTAIRIAKEMRQRHEQKSRKKMVKTI